MSQDQAHSSQAPEALIEKTTYPCAKCGASLQFSAGSGDLHCDYCGHQNAVVRSDEVIHEYDFYEALQQLEQAQTLQKTGETVVHCEKCAAEFTLEEHTHAGDCPFCGTPIVTSTQHLRHIKPRSLLPFSITEKQALEAFRVWINGLWFAPNAVKKYARSNEKLLGVYIPYWTYDSQTYSRYQGERGDIYYESVAYTEVVNGRYVRRVRQVPRVRWTPVSGSVQRHFDDVLIGASRTLPRKITARLEPWDLEHLVPFKKDYLSGFRSEVYQVELDAGFKDARHLMDQVIRRDVRYQIGGDQQRITTLHTEHNAVSFKHLLLPVWSAAFSYREKIYRFVINGRTGKVQGERPYSTIKIIFTILTLLILLGATFWLLEESGVIEAWLNSAPSRMQPYYHH